MTLRLGFMTLGPLNYFIDLAFLSSDTHRQALRDKFAQTYVVRKRAQPVGTAVVLYRYYEICCYHFLVRETEEGTERVRVASAN